MSSIKYLENCVLTRPSATRLCVNGFAIYSGLGPSGPGQLGSGQLASVEFDPL